MLNEKSKKEAIARLKKIQGQMRGIEKMVEEDRYCVDILDQVSAVRSALDGAALLLVRNHIDCCVTNSIKAGKGGKVVDELMTSLNRFIR